MFSAVLLLPALFLTIFCEPGDRSSKNVIFEKLNKEISGHSVLQIISYKTFTGAVNEDQSNAEELLQKLNESFSALPDKPNYGLITLLNNFNGLEVNNKSKSLIVSNNLVVNYKDLANKLQLVSGSLSFDENKNLLYRLNHLAYEYLQGLNNNVEGVEVIPLAYYRQIDSYIKTPFYYYTMTYAVLVGHLSDEGLAGIGGLVLQTNNSNIFHS